MTCQREYAFFLHILQKAGIGCREFDLPAGDSGPELDAGLRRQLGLEPSVFEGCRTFFPYFETGAIYRLADRFYLQYLFLLLPGGDRCMAVGPYLSMRPSSRQVLETAERCGLTPAGTHLLEEFYPGIPLIVDNSPFYSMVYCLCEALFGREAEVHRMNLNDELVTAALANPPATADLTSMMRRLELRYRFEDELMLAVARGDRDKVRQALSDVHMNAAIEPRLADPVRNLKNYCIILNTILRKAAQRGGVHPIYLDDLSKTYAERIEQLPTTGAAYRIVLEMAEEYCLLVQRHSLSGYSPQVQQAMVLVRQHLSEPLSLRTVAAALDANPSYFSARFKKETGQTLTDFILQERLRLAMNLLGSTRLQVQSVAMHCGFLDVNYFSRLFRQSTGITPTEYRRRGQTMQS